MNDEGLHTRKRRRRLRSKIGLSCVSLANPRRFLPVFYYAAPPTNRTLATGAYTSTHLSNFEIILGPNLTAYVRSSLACTEAVTRVFRV